MDDLYWKLLENPIKTEWLDPPFSLLIHHDVVTSLADPSTVQHGPPCLLLKIVGEKHGENSRNLMRKQKDPKIWKSVFRLKEMENLGFHSKNQDLEVQKIHENPGYAKSQLAKKNVKY